MGDVCRQLGSVEKTFYRWREKYAGMEAGEAKRLRELEDQNARLKKLLALVGLWARLGPRNATMRGDLPQRA